jgi:hypothetical protein
MTFINPAVLFGLLAVGLPVIIHLLTKPRLKRIRWAATKFLLKSVQKNRRRVQMEDILLLVLRCLLVALLVLLFARPAFLTDSSGLDVGGASSTAVILLDNSMSMGQSNGTETRFEQAKSMADGILSKLGTGSAVALFMVADSAKPVVPKPTQELAVVQRSLTQAELTDRGTDLYPGLKAAVDLLKPLSGKREIFLLTDSQESAWRELQKIRQLQDENKKDLTIHFLIVGDKGEDNLAVSGLQMIGTVAAVNQPLRCAVTVTNWSKTTAQHVPVKLATDGDSPQDEAMIDQIDPGKSRVVNLFVRFRDPGYHSITASIPGDRLPADNQRSIALLVLEQIKALVVEGTNNPDPSARDGFFLRHALVPVRPDQVDEYPIKVTVGGPPEVEGSTLDQYQLVFLSNVAQLTPLGAQSLQKYVNAGGALIIFPGASTDISYYNTTLGALLPAQLGAAQDAPAAQKFLGWQSHGYEHPITTLWNDPASGNLGAVRISKYFPLTQKPDDNAARTVVKYANGEPAVMEQSVGKGKVILFSNTATTAWSSLPIHPAFVPLLLRIISYAISGPGGKLDLAPGQPFTFEIDSNYAGKELSVLRPGDKKRRIVGQVESGEHSAVLHDTDTEQAGPYQLFVEDDPKPKVVFAVESDPAESNLNQEDKANVDPLIAVADAANPDTDATDKPKDKGQMIPGPPIWIPLALAALILAIVEIALAHRFSQSK